MITNIQRDLRKSGIGGSDIAAIMGLNPYSTPMDVYLAKTGDVDVDETSPIEWGNRLEKVVVQKFMEEHSEFDVEFPDTKVVGNKIANVDGLLTLNGKPEAILEIKTASAFSDAWNEGVPVYYQCQVQWYMALFDLDTAFVACLKGGNEYQEYRIEKDERFIAEAFQKADDFWANLELGIAPEPSNTTEAQAAFPKSVEGEITVVNDEFVAAVNRLKEIKAETDMLKKEEDSLKAMLMSEMGDSEIAKDSEGRTVATWKTTTTKRFDSSAFKSAEPGLYESFRVESTYRTLRTK